MLRFEIPILIVLVIVIAGCAGLSGPTGRPTSPGAGDNTTTSPITNPTPTLPSGDLAPGLTSKGVENASKLVEAHTATLSERGFELDIQRRRVNENGSSEVTYRMTTTPGLERFRQNATGVEPDSLTVRRSWLNASIKRMLVRIDADGETSYRIPPVGPVGNQQARKYLLDRQVHSGWLVEILRAGDFEVSADRENGEVGRYRLVDSDGAMVDAFDFEEIHATVDANGVVHSLKATGQFRNGDSFTFGYHLVRLGVASLDRPAWVDAAPDIVDTRPTVGFQNCTTAYLEVKNPGPDAIPSGSTVTVEFDSATYTADLENMLHPGEARAIYLTDTGSLEVTDLDDVPSNRSAMPNEAEITITTDEGMVLSRGGIGFGCERASEGSETGESASAGDRSERPS